MQILHPTQTQTLQHQTVARIETRPQQKIIMIVYQWDLEKLQEQQTNQK